MEPGDMVLYESHSIIHGRPFPLKGRSYANIFIHFEPTGHSNRHLATREGDNRPMEQFEEARKKRQEMKKENFKKDDLPVYIVRGSEEEERWKQSHHGRKRQKDTGTLASGSTAAHRAAANSDLETLKEIVADNPGIIQIRDENGWQPIHEAARSGLVSIVDFLVSKGADVNSRTNDGKGATPLWWAKQTFSSNHQIVKRLLDFGAKEIPPE
mmetsp:Transcript_43931/g.51462  ORF Transcript_43931/g.51462 Transcript_43931/m.51462 type:complete len:212 (-) Transcript_43931:430-1065(-)